LEQWGGPAAALFSSHRADGLIVFDGRISGKGFVHSKAKAAAGPPHSKKKGSRSCPFLPKSDFFVRS
jgi:hypothetical protein